MCQFDTHLCIATLPSRPVTTIRYALRNCQNFSVRSGLTCFEPGLDARVARLWHFSCIEWRNGPRVGRQPSGDGRSCGRHRCVRPVSAARARRIGRCRKQWALGSYHVGGSIRRDFGEMVRGCRQRFASNIPEPLELHHPDARFSGLRIERRALHGRFFGAVVPTMASRHHRNAGRGFYKAAADFRVQFPPVSPLSTTCVRRLA